MARKGLIEKDKRRARCVEQYGAKKDALRAKMKDQNVSIEEKMKISLKMSKMPRDSSRVRAIRRCFIKGRSRGVLQKRYRGLCMFAFRELASNGLLPGVIKSSW